MPRKGLVPEQGFAFDDIIVDVAVSALVVDPAGQNRAALEAIRTIGADPELMGIHLFGGITDIGQQLPPKAADGSDLKLKLGRAFVTVAMPLGLDTILATPRHDFSPLPEGDAVLEHFKRILALSGADLLRQARKLYRLA